MNWQRWNTATHIFELSTDDGGSWAPLALDGSIITEGLVATARLGSGTAAITKFLRGDQSWIAVDFTQLTGSALKAQLPASIAYEDEANVFSLNQLIYKTRPEIQLLDSSSGTGKTRTLVAVPDSGSLTQNISYDGTNWNLDDITKEGTIIHLIAGQIQFYTASAGANPRTLTSVGGFTGAGLFTSNTQDVVGGQVKFPATQNPSSDANTLDDYEEGTWTPADASGAGLSFTQQIGGQYIKIGQLVIATWGVLYPATASGAGAAISLPFTPQATHYDGGVFYNTFVAGLTALVNSSSANMTLFNGATQVTNVNMSGKDVRGTAIYRASA